MQHSRNEFIIIIIILVCWGSAWCLDPQVRPGLRKLLWLIHCIPLWDIKCLGFFFSESFEDSKWKIHISFIVMPWIISCSFQWKKLFKACPLLYVFFFFQGDASVCAGCEWTIRTVVWKREVRIRWSYLLIFMICRGCRTHWLQHASGWNSAVIDRKVTTGLRTQKCRSLLMVGFSADKGFFLKYPFVELGLLFPLAS